MYNLSAADVKTNVTTVAYKITGLCICKTTYIITAASLCTGRMWKTDTEVRIYAHGKTGAVCSVCQTGTTIYIWVTDKLECIACYARACAAA